MAETVSIEGQPFLKRNPLGVLGLSVVTFGIYFLYWYYKVNDELRRFVHDESISPTRSLMAMLFGGIIIVAVHRDVQHSPARAGGRAADDDPAAARTCARDRAHVCPCHWETASLHPGAPQPDLGSGRGGRRGDPANSGRHATAAASDAGSLSRGPVLHRGERGATPAHAGPRRAPGRRRSPHAGERTLDRRGHPGARRLLGCARPRARRQAGARRAVHAVGGGAGGPGGDQRRGSPLDPCRHPKSWPPSRCGLRRRPTGAWLRSRPVGCGRTTRRAR